jgi:hypothetical protein
LTNPRAGACSSTNMTPSGQDAPFHYPSSPPEAFHIVYMKTLSFQNPHAANSEAVCPRVAWRFCWLGFPTVCRCRSVPRRADSVSSAQKNNKPTKVQIKAPARIFQKLCLSHPASSYLDNILQTRRDSGQSASQVIQKTTYHKFGVNMPITNQGAAHWGNSALSLFSLEHPNVHKTFPIILGECGP